jgi:hypothetical protein
LGELRQLAGKVAPVTLAGELLLPVGRELADLLPGRGLRRGSVVGVGSGATGSAGATSLLLSLVSAASAEGSWVGFVGLTDVGWVAAAEAGLSLERIAVVANPGGQWPMVAAALMDALDIVVLRPPARARVRRTDATRLLARARERGSVLIVMGDAWPDAPDIRLSPRASTWTGLGAGHGVLVERALDVAVDGRRAAARERRAVLSA